MPTINDAGSVMSSFNYKLVSLVVTRVLAIEVALVLRKIYAKAI
jgi:hypothetical protein